jgi:mono/diheme cytochrome c family protein
VRRLLIVAFMGLAAAVVALWRIGIPSAGLSDEPALIARGKEMYAAYCASCHGQKLEGQPDWQTPRPDGRMPAPPHNSDGHTWHHPYAVLVGITKHGLVPPYAPPGYESDMPAFAEVLDDEDITAVLSFIASTWNEEAKAWQRQVGAQANE